ncbi:MULTISPECIES: ABC transporter permease [unclassified Bacillus (in: firmicutes)]|uniref:ABC transporter permease n=1 Tax=unclassified Bacillus (in: firmicutes) TaxID=185979 RepID=UPI0008EB8C78|nr:MULTISPECIES: ABC transporter permease [unclassified Bacillus (in: firmicutes)]SFA79924.1 ABC-2 type transport system permease protein [Bacillus sp. UNCCL13]SFQ69989.1 ABC-2 type transport system permease protein [Bacillus sp. cl95]
MFDDKKLWKERASRRSKDMSRYLRYIFNGHLVIVLFFLLGTAAYYYQGWVQTLSGDFPAEVIMAVVFGFVLTYSPVYTFLLEADRIFLLPVETKMKDYFFRSTIVSIAFQSYILLMVLAAFMPLYAKVSGQGFGSFLMFFVVLLAIKGWNVFVNWQIQFFLQPSIHLSDKIVRFMINAVFIYLLFVKANWIFLVILGFMMILFYAYFRKQTVDKSLKWESLIDQEEKRMTSFYRFANLFTDVPQLKDSVKRRKWLDFIANRIPYSQEKAFQHLFMLAFLRSGDFFGLFIRLTLIGGAAVYLISFQYGQIALSLLFLYLTGFQLLPLWNHYNNKIWLELYPLKSEQKKTAFQSLLFKLMMIQSVLFALMMLVKGDYIISLLAFSASILFSIFFVYFYNNKKLFT